MSAPLCRIGVFIQGSFFIYAQHHYYRERGLGWLAFPPFLSLIVRFIRLNDREYAEHRVVYAAWYQGVSAPDKATERQLRKDRERHLDLIQAGVEPKFLPMSHSGGEEGVNVALALDALQVGLEGNIDVAVLVTGAADHVPLARALVKQGIRVAVVYFGHETSKDKCSADERLLKACDYALNVNELEFDYEHQELFRELFRRSDSAEPEKRPGEDLKAA